jgi:hypothetical protein
MNSDASPKLRDTRRCVRGSSEPAATYGRDARLSGTKPVAFPWVGSIVGLAAALILSVSFAGETVEPISLHPENPHYFSWRGKPTILITSGEHYGALLNLDFDYVRYFDELAAYSLNHTRTFSGSYREIPASFGITDNPLAPKPNRYICPWARSHQPGYSDGGNKFDLKEWDPAYFQRLNDFMAQARKRGIVVEMTLFCPMYRDELWQACPMNAANNVNGIGKCQREEVYTLKHRGLTDVQIALTRKMVAELQGFDNLYYEVCNEPYFGGVTLPWQHKIVDTIVEAEKGFSNRHLISMNIANGRQKVENAHPAVSIFNFHYCVPPDTVEMNYGLNRVIGENETGFRGRHDLLYRSEGWDFLIAGGGLYNNLDYSFTPKHPDGSFLDYKSPGGGSPTLRRQLKILKEFLYGFDFLAMKPDNSVIRSVSPKMSARALVQRGKAYAVYLHPPIPRKPKDLQSIVEEKTQANLALDLPAGNYVAEWVNPRTGRVDREESFTHVRGSSTIRSPVFTEDIALRLVRK